MEILIGILIALTASNAVSAFFYVRLAKRSAVRKAQLNEYETQVELMQSRIRELGGTPVGKLRIDPEGNIRRD